MPIPIYCTAKKRADYLRLLHFARITTPSEESPEPKKDKEAIAKSLSLSLKSFSPSPHQLLPLIYHNAGQAGLRDLFAPKVLEALREKTLLLVGAEMRNQQWLNEILESHEKEKIPVILLKGAAFAGSLYPANTPRVGVDIDLLVFENDFEIACELLSKSMNPVLLSSGRVATHDTLFERVFTPKKGIGPTVEIHRALTNPSIFNIDEKKLWPASRKHPIYNSELVRILSPEDTLLHLAVHAFRDLDFCTHNILDAHEVWYQWKPDQKMLLERAEQWGAQKLLFYLLANCKAIMETPVPDTLLNNLKPASVINAINKKILQSTILNDTNHASLPYRLIQLTSQITFPDRISRGLRFQLIYAKTRINDWLIAHKGQ